MARSESLIDHPPICALTFHSISYALGDFQRKYIVISYGAEMPVVDIHAGPSYIFRVLSHRECYGN